MECDLCERVTDNEMVLSQNGDGTFVWRAYCDACISAIQEADDRIKEVRLCNDRST